MSGEGRPVQQAEQVCAAARPAGCGNESLGARDRVRFGQLLQRLGGGEPEHTAVAGEQCVLERVAPMRVAGHEQQDADADLAHVRAGEDADHGIGRHGRVAEVEDALRRRVLIVPAEVDPAAGKPAIETRRMGEEVDAAVARLSRRMSTGH